MLGYCLTKPATNLWDSVAFLNTFLVSCLYYPQAKSSPHPQAGNENRRAAENLLIFWIGCYEK